MKLGEKIKKLIKNKRLASELDLHVDTLLSEEDDTSPAETIQNRELTERVRMIEQLEPEDQQAIMRVIGFHADQTQTTKIANRISGKGVNRYADSITPWSLSILVL